MKKLLKLIIIVTVCLLIVVILLLINLLKTSNPEGFSKYGISGIFNFISSSSGNTEDPGEQIVYDTSSEEQASIPEDFYTVISIIEQYYESINSKKYNKQNENQQNVIKQKIFNILSANYKIENEIVSPSDILEKVEFTEQRVIFEQLETKVLNNYNKKSYAIHGFIIQESYDYIKDVYFVVELDYKNRTYTITPLNKNYKDINEIQLQNDNQSIEKNSNNTYSTVVASNQFVINYYVTYYKRMALSRPDMAFEMLDEDYRTRKFDGLEEYKQYLKKNEQTIISLTLSEYTVGSRNNSVEYICKNQYGNYYIFDEKDNFKFSVILDSYTISIPSIEKKYFASEDVNKAALNIEKIKEAINNKDYEYLYKYSYKEFRDKYYPTEQDIENFFKTNLYELNSFEYTNIETQEDNFIFNVTVTDVRSNAGISKVTQGLEKVGKKMVFVVKLYAGTEYAMSFSMYKEED